MTDVWLEVFTIILLLFYAPRRAYSCRFVHPSDCPSHFCLEHISKSIEGNLMKLETMIEGHEWNYRMQEP